MSNSTTKLYPQAGPFSDDELQEFLGRPLIAKLCTQNDDGTIHIAPLYFKYEDGVVLLGTQKMTQKVQNIRRNKQVTVLIDEDESPFQGVIIYGQAELSEEDVIPTRVAIFSKYKNVEQAQAQAERLAGTWQPILIRITPNKMISYDYKKGLGMKRA
jgi:PPOX class probable F420-dependent enzyme